MEKTCDGSPTRVERRLRTKRRRNYKELTHIALPRPIRQKANSSRLYPIDVVERDQNGRLKIHYIGFSSVFDEWREPLDIVPLGEEGSSTKQNESSVYLPFSLYSELGNSIKRALVSGRKESPHVRIEMPFDKLQFTGGLKASSTLLRIYRGIERYKITSYKDLDPLLGPNWHVRGINPNGDFCYVILDTLEFYLHKRKPLKEYLPSSGSPVVSERELGYALVFAFVRDDGTPATFGKDKSIFQ